MIRREGMMKYPIHNQRATNAFIVKSTNKPTRFPFCCPVCGGNGIKDEGFYLTTTGQWTSTAIKYVQCKTCNGLGMVWSI